MNAALVKPSFVPTGYSSVQPYLIFAGTSEAIAWYEKTFAATEKLRMKDDTGRISHAEIVIGNSVLMMADENPAIGAHAPAHFGGSPINLMIYVENCDKTYQKALESGAAALREPADQPYGDRMAGIQDPFGYKWWIGHPLSNSSEGGVHA